MGTDSSFYVKSIATYVTTVFGYIFSVLAILLPKDQTNYKDGFKY